MKEKSKATVNNNVQKNDKITRNKAQNLRKSGYFFDCILSFAQKMCKRNKTVPLP